MPDEFWRGLPDELEEEFERGLSIRRNTIPDYRFDDLEAGIIVWHIWDQKNLLPFPGTYMQQPAHLWDMIMTFDQVFAQHVKRQQATDEALQILKGGTGRRRGRRR